jgi:hypothetical protein
LSEPDDRGLSGEHIELCAEGARQVSAESLRQKDRDAMAVVYRGEAVLVGTAVFLFYGGFENAE